MVVKSGKASFDQINHHGNPCPLVGTNLGAQMNSCKGKETLQQILVGQLKRGLCSPMGGMGESGKTEGMRRMGYQRPHSLRSISRKKIGMEAIKKRKYMDVGG